MKKQPKDQQKITCSVHQLAEAWGMSERNIQHLEQRGIAIRIAHGRYDLAASCRNYIAHLEDEASSEDTEFEAARTRVYRARAEILETQSKAIRGELHDATCIAEVMGEGLANARAAFLAIPTRISPILADESDPNKCSEIIREAIYEALTHCSKYDGREVVNRHLAKQSKAPARSEDEDLQEVL
jgi:phage terminase Nu1 subunit (DNA packaging protein)